MSDAPVPGTAIESLSPFALIALDVWGDPAPVAARFAESAAGGLPALLGSSDLGDGWRAIRVEPTLWWLTGPLEDLDHRLAHACEKLGEEGAATDLSGAFVRISILGPHWRDMLMIGGVFDAEDPGFGPGSTAGTILHHTAVRYDVVAPDQVILYVAPSYAVDLLPHLRAAASRCAA